MKKSIVIIGGILIALLLVTGVVVYNVVTKPKPAPVAVKEDLLDTTLPVADASIVATATKSPTKDNTVVLSVTGLGSQYSTISYELSYESQGIVQGVTSKPLDVSGKDAFVRDDIYLGTCSRNVCRPHTGVKTVSVVLEFTSTTGKKSQLSKEFPF